MKKKFKNIFFKASKPVLGKLGYERKRSASGPALQHKNGLLEIFFTNIQSMGFTPKHIIDIGANHGTWTRETLTYFPNAYYTLIEPQEWLKPSFQDLLNANPKIAYHPVGAGSEAGSFKFTIVHRD